MGPGAKRTVTQGPCHREPHYTQGTRCDRGSEKEELGKGLEKLLQNLLEEIDRYLTGSRGKRMEHFQQGTEVGLRVFAKAWR